MPSRAILFVGLGSLVEYADNDREAWNAAFRANGLSWHWSWDTYAELMRPGGGRHLAARFADILGVSVDSDQLDKAHIRGFAARSIGSMPLRPGVNSVLNWAARGNAALALVSRGAPGMVYSLLASTARARGGIEFDAVLTREDGVRLAPHPDAIDLALKNLGVAPEHALAIADTPAGAAAALDAGLVTHAFPGSLAEDQVFPAGCVEYTALETHDIAASLGAPVQTAAE